MKYVRSEDALLSVGINPLTSEADRYAMRLLCDLSADGALLVGMFLGAQHIQFTENWNSKVGDQDAIASIMLPRCLFQELIRFALYHQGYEFIIQTDDHMAYYAWKGDETEDPALTHYRKASESGGNMYGWRLYRNPAPQGGGDRNTHTFTGRTI